MLCDRGRSVAVSRRNYLKGIGVAVSLGLASRATTGTVVADDDRFTSDLGEIEDATLTASRFEDAILVQSEVTPVAPGIELTSVTRLDERGWLEADVLVAEMDNGSTGAGLLSSSLTSRETVSNLTESERSVAGVNGDFFDIGNTNAPVGAEIGAGTLHKSPAPGHDNTISVGRDGLARLARVVLEGTVSLPDSDHSFVALNHYAVPTDSIGLYTPVWGDASRADVVGSASRVREVTVRDNVVAATADSVTDRSIPGDGYVLVGRGAGADVLSTLSKGDAVSVTYAPKTDVDASLETAVGGGTVLLRNGNLSANLGEDRLEPRTAAGTTADGSTLYLLAVDGRQRDSRGVSLHELGTLLRDLGASDALNLDGGGSTTLVAREPGESGVSLRNDPSDGAERPVSNGFGLGTVPGSGHLTGFNVRPALTGENTHRVFPGLSRTFIAKAHDETYAPVDASPTRWHAVPGRLGTFDDGRFSARKIGTGSATARRRGATGETRLRVLDHLDRLDTDPNRIGLEPGGEGTFSVLGFDSRGYAAPIAPREVSLDYDGSLIDIEATDEGSFRITSTGEKGSSSVSLSVFDQTTYLPVSVGLAVEPVAGFDDPSAWYFDQYPAVVEGSMSFVEGRTGQALRLDYDFTTTLATRAVYARRESRIDLPSGSQALGMWVKGDGNGAWLRCVVYDGAGVAHRLDLTYSVDWTGWQYVEASIPSGIKGPLQFSHLYPVEADSDQQYTGHLVFDDLTAKVTPTLDVPETPTRPDPLVVENETRDDERWTFAVMADSQFVAEDPDSLAAQLARRTLREVVAADPAFLIIAGDFVDTGYPEDFDLAKRMLREEVGDALPVYYIPGNHEIMGSNSLDNFKAEFEQTRYTFDYRGTRFFLLNSSTGSFRTADFSQLVDLKNGLAAAMSDDDVENVVVVAHHPTRDPLPTDNSQLGDRMEAELIEEWLTAFRERDGKGAIYIAGHAGTVDVSRVEGAPYMVVSTTGKDPYGVPAEGGFREWTLFGVEPDGDEDDEEEEREDDDKEEREDDEDDFPIVELSDWMRAEVRPLLIDATIDAPSTLTVDETAVVTATGIQNAGLTFPLEYPATVHWEGSDDLLIDDTAEEHNDAAESEYVATFDPSTGKLTGIQPGTVLLRVTSNGTSAEETVSIRHID